MADTAIEIEDLHVVRGGRSVIDGLDLHVAAGSVTGLLGPSGCGKSTLMRAIVGVQITALQAVVVCLVGFLALGLHAPHGAWLVGLLAVGNAVLGMALGLFVSAFARTEFQAVQFMPAIIFPQLLLCGLFVDRHEMASALYGVSWVLPLTYAYDALARATRSGALGGRMAIDICVILGATLVALALGALTLRRRTA